VKPELIERYVEDGTLRMEWRDFPYQGPESTRAALAARTAQAQGKFWEYHDLIYANQSETFTEEFLVDLAEQAGLDVSRFEEDFYSGRYEEAVISDFQEGQRIGINSTPTFIVNDQAVVGLQPMETFEQVIEEARREAEGG
jgi:protein-disulfide isomerase